MPSIFVLSNISFLVGTTKRNLFVAERLLIGLAYHVNIEGVTFNAEVVYSSLIHNEYIMNGKIARPKKPCDCSHVLDVLPYLVTHQISTVKNSLQLCPTCTRQTWTKCVPFLSSKHLISRYFIFNKRIKNPVLFQPNYLLTFMIKLNCSGSND